MWGWTSHTAFATTTNRKELMKVESVKLTDISEYYSWYMRLQNHAMANGVYVYNLEEVRLNDIMGSVYATKYGHIFVKRETMSTLLFTLLSHDDVIPKNLAHLRSAVRDAAGNGYAALYNLHLAAKHPNLIEDDDVATEVPKQRSGEGFSRYKQRLENYFISEELRGRLFTDAQAINLFKSNLLGMYKAKFSENIRHIYTPTKDAKVPFQLHFSQISITCDQWCRELSLPIPGKERESVAHLSSSYDDTLSEGYETDYEDDVNAIDTKTCSLCGNPHDAVDCFPLIDLVLMLDYLSKNKSARQAILDKYKGSRLRRGVHRQARGRSDRDGPRHRHTHDRNHPRRHQDRVNQVKEQAFMDIVAESNSPPTASPSTSIQPYTALSATANIAPSVATNNGNDAVLAVDDGDHTEISDESSWRSSDDDVGDIFLISDADTPAEQVCGVFDIEGVDSFVTRSSENCPDGGL